MAIKKAINQISSNQCGQQQQHKKLRLDRSLLILMRVFSAYMCAFFLLQRRREKIHFFFYFGHSHHICWFFLLPDHSMYIISMKHNNFDWVKTSFRSENEEIRVYKT